MLIFLVFCGVPWYFITYKSGSGRKVRGYKEFHFRNVDDAFNYFRDKAKQVDPNHTEFNCVMVSTQSLEWQEWNRNRKAAWFVEKKNRSGPGKYR